MIVNYNIFFIYFFLKNKMGLSSSKKKTKEIIASEKKPFPNKKDYNDFIENLYNSPKAFDLTIFESNFKKLVNVINSLSESSDDYISLSCIYGAFMGDSIGQYVEFKKPNNSNHQLIYQGLSQFGTEPGSVTDDSYMAMSLAFGIMDNNILKELNENLIYFYYGAWNLTNPRDIGITTSKALSYFTYNKSIYGDIILTEKIKDMIYKSNYKSKANGFLMRISTFVVFFYYRFEDFCMKNIINNKDNLFILYDKIKNIIVKDNEITHPNEENNIACGIFVFMCICAMFKIKGKEIIKKVELLLENKIFSEKENEKNVKKIILENLEDFKKEGLNYKNFNVYNKMGYYVHAYKFTLYYLWILDDIKENQYEYIMNEICDYGGDTDTNCAIVGTAIGPLIGFKNFNKNLWDIFINYYPKDGPQFSSALMYIYVKYLELSNKWKDNSKLNYNFYQMIHSMLYKNINNFNSIFDK